MRLICNGVALDLKEGAALSMQKENILFALGDVTMERTHQFQLPATLTNNTAFGLANVPAFHGTAMRKRFDAQLQCGAVAKDGYLYVDSYDKNGYNAVFVTGDYLGLKEIKEAGNISELYDGDNTLAKHSDHWYSPAEIMRETWRDGYSFCNVLYLSQYYELLPEQGKLPIPRRYPSIAFGSVVKRCADVLGVTANWDTLGDIRRARLIPSTPEQFLDEVRFISAPLSNAASTGGYCNSATSSADFLKPAPIKMQRVIITADELGRPHFERNEDWFLLQGWKTNKPITITMPDEFNMPFRNTGIVINDIGGGSYFRLLSNGTHGVTTPEVLTYFHGERGEVKHVQLDTTTLPPLVAGQEVDIPAGVTFAFYDFNPNNFGGAEKGLREFTAWTYGSVGTFGLNPYDFVCSVRTTGVVKADDKTLTEAVWSIYDNIPDISLLDAMRVLAYINGKVLTYSDADGVQFKTYDVSDGDVVDVTKNVISVDKLTRSVGKWSQHNVVEFDSGDYVLAGERSVADYIINNDNISADEKRIFRIPFSEGGSGRYLQLTAGIPVLVRNDVEDDVDKSILTFCEERGSFLSKIFLKKDAELQSLCDESTTLSVSVRMTLAEYEAVKSNTRLMLDGRLWVWIDATWSKNVAKWTIAKLSA